MTRIAIATPTIKRTFSLSCLRPSAPSEERRADLRHRVRRLLVELLARHQDGGQDRTEDDDDRDDLVTHADLAVHRNPPGEPVKRVSFFQSFT